jgi:hypothetical protein
MLIGCRAALPLTGYFVFGIDAGLALILIDFAVVQAEGTLATWYDFSGSRHLLELHPLGYTDTLVCRTGSVKTELRERTEE